MVGVSADKEKYGYEVFKTLVDYGYWVYPVNPKYESIESQKCFKSPIDLPERPKVVVTVAPSSVPERIVENCARLGVSTIWMPPGSWSKAALKKGEENKIKIIHDVCLVFALK